MPLAESLFHLLLISVVIALVIAAMRKDTPAAIAFTALKFFAMTIAVLAGIKIVLHILIQIGS